jgi:hypothetical protein
MIERGRGDVHAVELGTLVVTGTIGAIEHGAPAVPTEAPQDPLRRSIPLEVVLASDQLVPIQGHTRPTDERRAVGPPTAFTVAVGEKVGG